MPRYREALHKILFSARSFLLGQLECFPVPVLLAIEVSVTLGIDAHIQNHVSAGQIDTNCAVKTAGRKQVRAPTYVCFLSHSRRKL